LDDRWPLVSDTLSTTFNRFFDAHLQEAAAELQRARRGATGALARLAHIDQVPLGLQCERLDWAHLRDAGP
jgi:hypothetical protein